MSSLFKYYLVVYRRKSKAKVETNTFILCLYFNLYRTVNRNPVGSDLDLSRMLAGCQIRDQCKRVPVLRTHNYICCIFVYCIYSVMRDFHGVCSWKHAPVPHFSESVLGHCLRQAQLCIKFSIHFLIMLNKGWKSRIDQIFGAIWQSSSI